MLRPIILKADTNAESLASDLLRARLSEAQADAARGKLAEANPHLDTEKIAAGTVVLVPDTPGFKTADATSIQSEPFGDFSALAQGALGAAAERAKAGIAARKKERADIAAALKSAAFRRLTANDPDTQRQVEQVVKAATEDADADKQAAEMLEAISKAARAALDELGKVVR